MATSKTECTELSIAFGLLELDPVNPLKQPQVDSYFVGSLNAAKYTAFTTEFAGNKKFYRRFYDIGLRLRNSYSLFRHTNFKNVQWEGPSRQASTVSVAIDR